MIAPRTVGVSGMGLVTALGSAPSAVVAAIDAGRSGVRAAGDHRDLLPVPGFAIADVDVRPLLVRKKDRKLLPRAAELALVATAGALGGEPPASVAFYLGVGREPPDEGETEAALMAALRDGRFDAADFAARGLEVYPPLASLRTLPNLVLAHVAIQLGLTGQAGTRTGEEAAGLAAVVEGWLAVAEGRAEVALAGGADSRVDAGTARDLVRLGRVGPDRAPGEAAAVLKLEPVARIRARGEAPLAIVTGAGLCFGDAPSLRPREEPAIGACGAAAGVVTLALGLWRGGSGRLHLSESSGAGAWVGWQGTEARGGGPREAV